MQCSHRSMPMILRQLRDAASQCGFPQRSTNIWPVSRQAGNSLISQSDRWYAALLRASGPKRLILFSTSKLGSGTPRNRVIPFGPRLSPSIGKARSRSSASFTPISFAKSRIQESSAAAADCQFPKRTPAYWVTSSIRSIQAPAAQCATAPLKNSSG